jgi:geranylgeranyl diphosphate synthase type II
MNDRIKKSIDQIDKAIREIEFGDTPANLYDPIRYILVLGGKRIRPLLSVLSYKLYHDDIAKVLKPALAVEVFHNFTLLHDDIMDRAPMRRNRPTVHKKWNNNIAILSGDVMLVRVYDLLLQVDKGILKDVISGFNNCAAEVCEGQQFDMDFETRTVVTEREYINMIRLKTAVLLGYSLELGGLIAGAGYIDLSHLRNFGINIGIGFQLMDDLLDVYGSEDMFGKKVGGDIISNKKTYLLIKALELAKGQNYEELINWTRAREFDLEEKVKAVTSIYDRLGIEALAKKQINNYFEKGLAEFDKVNVQESRKADLMQLTRYLMNRKK